MASKMKLALSVRQAGDGELIHYYDQDLDPRTHDGDLVASTHGWCIGMSTQWIKYHKQKGDFWPWMDSSAGQIGCRVVMASQAVRQKIGNNWDKWDVAKTPLARIGLTRQSLDIMNPATAAGIAQKIQPAGSCYYAISIFWHGGSGHAIAAAAEGKAIRFLDPAAGEFLFPKASSFAAWLPKFFDLMGYTGALSWAAVQKFV